MPRGVVVHAEVVAVAVRAGGERVFDRCASSFSAPILIVQLCGSSPNEEAERWEAEAEAAAGHAEVEAEEGQVQDNTEVAVGVIREDPRGQ